MLKRLKMIGFGAVSNIKPEKYGEGSYILSHLKAKEGEEYRLFGVDTPLADDQVWRYWIEIGYEGGSSCTYRANISPLAQRVIKRKIMCA